MKDYSKMSDFEINKWIAIEFAPNGYIGINESTRSDSEVVITTENGEWCTKNSYVDYCNNPSDAWPIIFENEISLVVVEDGLWVAMFGSVFDESSNPLRSAMIVYLMMKDGEK